MDRLFKAVLRVLGIPEPLEIERKFLVENNITSRNVVPVPFGKELIRQRYIDVPESFLIFPAGRSRLRLVAGSYFVRLYFTQKSGFGLVRKESEVVVSTDDYCALLAFEMADREEIFKTRYYFIYKHQYFLLDVFMEPEWAEGLCLLEIELLDENDKVELPPFLNIVKEVTGDPEYTNSAIARKR